MDMKRIFEGVVTRLITAGIIAGLAIVPYFGAREVAVPVWSISAAIGLVVFFALSAFRRPLTSADVELARLRHLMRSRWFARLQGMLCRTRRRIEEEGDAAL